MTVSLARPVTRVFLQRGTARIVVVPAVVHRGPTGATGPTGQAGTNATTTADATQSVHGLMAAVDKVKVDHIVANVLDYGADPTGVANSTTAFTNAMAAGSAYYIPAGTYSVDIPLITRPLTITGDGPDVSIIIPRSSNRSAFDVIGSAEAGGIGGRHSVINGVGVHWASLPALRAANTAVTLGAIRRTPNPDDSNHFVLECTTAGTTHATVVPTWSTAEDSEGATVADGTVVWTYRVASAFRMRERATIENVGSDKAPGNAVHIVASSAAVVPKNANGFYVGPGRHTNPGKHGIFIDGTDANAGEVDGADIDTAAGYGVFDSSFLGHNLIKAQVAGAVLGAFASDSANSNSVFVDCYVEASGNPKSQIKAPAAVIGGNLFGDLSATPFGSVRGPTLGAGEYAWQTDGLYSDSPSTAGVVKNRGQLGEQTNLSAFLAKAYEANGTVVPNADFRISHKFSGYAPYMWRFDLANSDGGTAAIITTANSGASGLPACVFGGANGLLVGGVDGFGNSIYLVEGTAAPTTGTWRRGDIVLNRSPSTGTTLYWRCTAAGTPGTWEDITLAATGTGLLVRKTGPTIETLTVTAAATGDTAITATGGADAGLGLFAEGGVGGAGIWGRGHGDVGVYGEGENGGGGVWGVGDGAAEGVLGYGGDSGGAGIVGYGGADGGAGGRFNSSTGPALIIEGQPTSPAFAAVRWLPQDTQPTGASELGDQYVTSVGVPMICTVAGTPGTWAPIGAGTANAAITLTGDVTGSGTSSFPATIAASAVTLAKMADLAQDQFIGRTTASTGVPQTATITSAARTVLDDTTVSAMVDTLGGASATGTGGIVRATSPTLTTPVLGVATATSINTAKLSGAYNLIMQQNFGGF